MIHRLTAIAVVVVTASAWMPQASAEKYVRHVNGRQVIVHTNVAPVIVHRIFPPFLGKHVSERQLKVGRLPPAARQ